MFTLIDGAVNSGTAVGGPLAGILGFFEGNPNAGKPTISVTDISSGQTGRIPVNEWDPNKYQLLGS